MSIPAVDQNAQVPEELIDNRATDVEVEDSDGDVSHDPWDPEQIRIHTKTYSLRQIVDMIGEKDIDLAPDFQRNYVWKDFQRWNLIESLLLGIPLPSFYFNEERDGRLQVVDGVQRLNTINNFYNDRFPLRKLAYLSDLEGSYFRGLSGVFRRRIQNTQLLAHVIDPQTPYRVKFDVFKRINTGGSPLSAQEIRHCMSKDRSRNFLRNLVAMPEFERVMGNTVLNHPRMADREIALRLVAFHIIKKEEYRRYESLDSFLGEVTQRIDVALSDRDLERLTELAQQALLNAGEVFGSFAFRKWPLETDRKNPINRTLVESWGTALALRDPSAVKAAAAALRRCAQEMMTQNTDYLESISGGTGDPSKVETRMRLVEDAVMEIVG